MLYTLLTRDSWSGDGWHGVGWRADHSPREES